MEGRARGAETARGFAASSDRHTMGDHAALLLPDQAASAGAPKEPDLAGPNPGVGTAAAGPPDLRLVPPDTFETFFQQQYTNLLRAMYLTVAPSARS